MCAIQATHSVLQVGSWLSVPQGVDRRPAAWNQWPEISWRDLRSPGHLGDVPHAWIGAEYVLAVLSAFAYERPGDAALVIAAGVSEAWLEGEASHRGAYARYLIDRLGAPRAFVEEAIRGR